MWNGGPAVRYTMKKICNLFATLLLAGLLGPAFSYALDSELKVFLGGAPLPPLVRDRLATRVEAEKDRTSWIVEQEGMVYSLVALEIPEEEHPGTRKKMELSLLSAAAIQSHRNLLLYSAGTAYPRQRYASSEAVAGALLSLRQSHASGGTLLPGSHSDKAITSSRAVSLNWIPLDNIQGVLQDLPRGKAFDDAYCAQLYGISRSFFLVGNYEQALELLLEMRRFQWMNPHAWLDAAECFFRLGEPEEGVMLLEKTFQTMESLFSIDQLLRGGDLFGEAGKKELQQAMYQKARERFEAEKMGGPK